LAILSRFDDIEDGSELRRGSPAAHAVFGVPQTINAASFAVVEAVRKAAEIPIPDAVNITVGKCLTFLFLSLQGKNFKRGTERLTSGSCFTIEQLRDLHIGQSYDIHWTRHTSCPTEDEYLEMVSKSMCFLETSQELISPLLMQLLKKLEDCFDFCPG